MMTYFKQPFNESERLLQKHFASCVLQSIDNCRQLAFPSSRHRMRYVSKGKVFVVFYDEKVF